MRTNESEYKRLEDAIRDLKTENAELRKDLAELHEINRELHDDKQLDVVSYDIRTEIAELRKDKERMDWIDRTVDGLSRQIVDSEMEDEWLQWERRQTWLREE